VIEKQEKNSGKKNGNDELFAGSESIDAIGGCGC
jgi:hypothetical protein